MKTILIANQKGGIGKTTTATAIASILEEQGHKTLLIDADQQCNATDTYKAKIEDAPTIYDVMLDEDSIPIKEAIQHTEYGDILASDPKLIRAEPILQSAPDGTERLPEALEELAKENIYEYVVIDTAPSMDILLRNCIKAAEEVLIPVTTDRYAFQGLATLKKYIAAIEKYNNGKPRIAGLLLIKYNGRTNLGTQAYEQFVKTAEAIGTKLYKTTIRDTIKTREAQTARMPLIKYAPNATSALDYYDLVEEMREEGDL